MNPLVRTLGGLGVGAAALGAGAVAAVAARHHALAPEAGETYDPVPAVEHTIRTDDGVDLHVEVSEPDDPAWRERPTIVLCHGYTLSGRSWVLVRRGLHAAGYRVVAWDQRGHGSSSVPSAAQDAFAIRRLGRDLLAVVEAQAADGEIVLVGHSMGGMTIMALGALAPELVRDRVRAVAFVATSAGGEGELAVQLGDAVGRLAQRLGPSVLTPLGARPGVVAAARKGARELEDAVTYRYSYASPVPRSLLRYTADIILATPIEVMVACLAPISAHDEHVGLEAYAGIETLVLNGTNDLLTPPHHSDEIVRVLPQAEHVVVHSAGHLVMLEHPQVVVEQLLALVERSGRGADDEPARGRTTAVGQERPSAAARARSSMSRAVHRTTTKSARPASAPAKTPKGARRG